MQTLEAAQVAIHVALGYFVTFDARFIRDASRNMRGRTCFGGFHIGITEFRITEAVPEGPQRSAIEISIGAIVHGIIVERRQVVHASVERDGQTARWVIHSSERLR